MFETLHRPDRRLMPVRLPDFLVLGAQKSGTTWLDEVLRTHPSVYMPTLRKEVHFFDANFEKGPQWYGQYFRDAPPDRTRLGEATPMYLFDPQVPRRIFDTIPHAQLITMFRSPTDRAVSHYRHAQARRAFSGTFTEFMTEDATVIPRGMYTEQLQRYRDLWSADDILTLIFEEVIKDYDLLKDRLGSFLNIDVQAFGPPPSNKAVTRRPAMRRTKHLLTRFTAGVQSPVVDRIAGFARSATGMVTSNGQEFIDATPDEYAMLDDLYSDEIPRLEELIGTDLAEWRSR